MSLSPHISIVRDTIVDLQLSASHKIRQEAVPLLALLKRNVSYQYIRESAKGYGISEIQLTDLLGFLNTIGGLLLRRDRASQIKSIFEHGRCLTLGIRFSPLIRRSPCSKWNLFVGLLRVTIPLMAAALIAATLMVIGNFVKLESALIHLAWGLSIFIGGLWIHEITHLVLIESAGMKSDILQSNLRIGILHARLAPRTEIASAVLGPLAGIIFGVLIILITYSLRLPSSLTVIAACTAAFHFGSFLPWYGDGASIQRSIKSCGVNYGNSSNN